MSKRTPTIEQAKYAYEHSVLVSGPEMRDKLGAEFDRFLAKVKADAKAEALLEAREHFKQVRFLRPIDGNIVGQYLTDTINRIEKETKDA